jgi:DNA-binding transcriptional MocR family regulator
MSRRLPEAAVTAFPRTGVPAVPPCRLAAVLGNWSRGSGPLYGGLAAGLRRAVARGDLPPGTRLPAERALAATLLVSRGTVVAAYDELRLAGVLDSRQGSGTWVRPDAPRPAGLLHDAAPAAQARRLAGRLLDRSADTIDLAVSAVSGLDGLPEDLFRMPDLATLERLGGGHGYQPLGMPALRERIAGYHRREGLPTVPGQVAVTAGAQQAIALVGQLLVRPGDAVVVEVPAYPGALDVLTRLGARVVPVPAGEPWSRTGALRAAVERNAARLVYLAPACANPTGRVTSEARRREAARIADEREVYVLEDNSLADVVLSGRRLPPVAAYSRSGRVLTVGSLSKVGWGGLRIGWVRGPDAFLDALGRMRAALDLGPSALPQVVGIRVLDDLERLATTRRALLRERLDVAQDELARLLPSWTWDEPDGGLSLWARLPAGDADELVQAALRHGVDVTPGSAHSVDGAFDDRVRLSCAVPVPVLREGITRLAAAWREYESQLVRRTAC